MSMVRSRARVTCQVGWDDLRVPPPAWMLPYLIGRV